MSIYDLNEVAKRMKKQRLANPANIYDLVEMRKLLDQLKDQKCSMCSRSRSLR